MKEIRIMLLELPLELAPVLNSYANMPSFKRAKLRKLVDERILLAKQHWTCWSMGMIREIKASVVNKRIRKIRVITGGRARRLILTRCSSKQPDEMSCDVLGGKIPIDRLAQACVIRDDNQTWLKREARWEYAPPGHGKVVIEVLEL